MPRSTTQEFINHLRTDLLEARKARDQLVTTTLQTLLSAIDNAGAVPIPDGSVDPNSTEVPRRELSLQDIHELVEREILELQHTIEKLGDREKSYTDELGKRVTILENYYHHLV